MDYYKSFTLIKNLKYSKIDRYQKVFEKYSIYVYAFFVLIWICFFVLKIENTYLMIGTIVPVFLLYIFSGVLKLRNSFSYEQVTYDSDGRCFFSKDFIQINDDVFYVNDIVRLEISNNDVAGNYKGYDEYQAAWSSGTNNFITIYFENWNFIKKQFVVINFSQFQNIQLELIAYLHKGLLTEQQVLSILSINDYNEIKIFRRIVESQSQ